jgi:hypothetical protein
VSQKPADAPLSVQLARQWVVNYFNAQSDDAAREFITPTYALEIGDYVFNGRDTQWLPAVAQQFAQFPGMGMTVHQVVAGSGDKADRVAVWFSEHGASGGPGGPLAVWSGVGIYRTDGKYLVGCCAQEDYVTRSRQLRSGITDAVDPPAPAPWDTLPQGENPEAEMLVREWLQQDWPCAQGAVRVDDDHITGQPLCFEVNALEVVDIFSSGEAVAFHVRQHGHYQGGLLGVPARERVELLNVNGILQVRQGVVHAGRVIRDRAGLKARLLKD